MALHVIVECPPCGIGAALAAMVRFVRGVCCGGEMITLRLGSEPSPPVRFLPRSLLGLARGGFPGIVSCEDSTCVASRPSYSRLARLRALHFALPLVGAEEGRGCRWVGSGMEHKSNRAARLLAPKAALDT